MPADSRPCEPSLKKLPTRSPTGGVRSPPTETESPKSCGNSHADRLKDHPRRAQSSFGLRSCSLLALARFLETA